jgi:murein DD-endopeptidase MepM/ murein hydrolase activator NlpD
MQQMPTLGRTSRLTPAGKLLVAATIALAVGVAALWLRRRAPAPRAPSVTSAGANAPAAASAPAAANPPVVAASAPAAAPAPPRPPPASELLARAGYRALSAVVDGPLERAVVAGVGRELGLPLTQVVVRTLVWCIEVPADLRKGDVVEVLFQPRSGEEPVVDAVRFHSEKLGTTFRAYRYKPSNSRFSRFYQADGAELELRLKDAPLDDYDQITSLLKDGRGHKGVDFRVPVGTAVRAPFDGRVARKTWAFRMNGNSLDIVDGSGRRRVELLHLSAIAPELRVGSSVSRGQVVAKSGNTGHSFAPHLHYQLMSGDGTRVLDPFVVQETARRRLGKEDEAPFAAEVKRLDGLLDLGVGKGN